MLVATPARARGPTGPRTPLMYIAVSTPSKAMMRCVHVLIGIGSNEWLYCTIWPSAHRSQPTRMPALWSDVRYQSVPLRAAVDGVVSMMVPERGSAVGFTQASNEN